ncbi:SCO3374 family protein [Streptomyces sporangiiformans]|uniref:Proline-rich protein n=1 Tax=Streptomyces sporangiiformans TaxID=2315329 RepID=A0A505DJ07_9ACTN|nr:SCO3374 family protein [Streptomyces sporangiiformans]TPQ20818.1 hypothetical protein FGD71_017660 [Streptomyces sporangiiformans]
MPLPLPRRPLDAGAPGQQSPVRQWYENELGWSTVPGPPVELLTGLRFDVLDVPAEAGYAALRHLGPGSPVAVRADRMRLLVAAGSADELPGLLDWLEWGCLSLDLRAIGAGGRIEAPLPPRGARNPAVDSSQGAAVWLRPPGTDCEVEPALPTLSALGGGGGGAPDLVRLVNTMATQCHRIRLRQAAAQALAFS